METEQLAYKTLGLKQTHQVIEAYRKRKSCLAVSGMEGIYVSSATVSRVVGWAVEVGLMEKIEKNGPGTPRVDRELIVQAVESHPTATRKQIGDLVGCSEATVYRALAEWGE